MVDKLEAIEELKLDLTIRAIIRIVNPLRQDWFSVGSGYNLAHLDVTERKDNGQNFENQSLYSLSLHPVLSWQGKGH